MIKIIRLMCLLTVLVAYVNVSALMAVASEGAEATGSGSLVFEESDPDIIPQSEPDLQDSFPSKTAQTITAVSGFTGYRFMTIDGYGGRAAKYSYLHSGIIGGASINRLGQNLKLSLEGNYLNVNDYHGDLYYDYAGDYRVHLRTETFYHNLAGEKLFTDTFRLRRADLPGALADYIPHQDDVSTDYGLRTEQDSANIRYKIHDFPLHINLGYWRMVKEGTTQIRFADSAFEGAENNVFARSRSIIRETHEGKIGFDTHLGPIDIIYGFQIRQFNSKSPQLLDTFSGRNDINGAPVTIGGLQEHNVDPDSRYYAHTVKVHTSLAGGIVGAGSYTYGKRDNISKLRDTTAAGQTSVRLHNGAGDLVYTPFKELSLGVKYRRQELDNYNPPTITNSFYLDSTLAVRSSVSSQKDIILATVLWRPINLLTIKGEYTGEFLHRDISQSDDATLSWYLNENQETHKGIFSVTGRPIKGLRVSARYGYTATDNPSYGTSFAVKHEGELTTNYNITKAMGVTASYRIIREFNDEITRRTISSINPVEYTLFSPQLSRDKTTQNVTASVWFAPIEKLTITANYGFLQNDTGQAVMFTITGNGSLAASNYKSRSNLYSLSSTYQLSEKLDLSLILQEVHSISEFLPEDKTFSAGNDTSGVKELSRTKTTETSFSARTNYRMTRNLTCSLEYMLQDFYDKFDSLFDGTVHTVMAAVSAKW